MYAKDKNERYAKDKNAAPDKIAKPGLTALRVRGRPKSPSIDTEVVAAVAGGLRLRVFLVDHVLSMERRNSSKAMTTIHHNPSPTNIRCYRVCGEESRTVSVELEGFHRTGLIDQLATCGPVVL